MDVLTINNTIEHIEKDLEFIKSELQILQNRKRIEEEKKESLNPFKLEKAILMKKIYSELATGKNSWETAESVKDFFPSVWDAARSVPEQRCRTARTW